MRVFQVIGSSLLFVGFIMGTAPSARASCLVSLTSGWTQVKAQWSNLLIRVGRSELDENKVQKWKKTFIDHLRRHQSLSQEDIPKPSWEASLALIMASSEFHGGRPDEIKSVTGSRSWRRFLRRLDLEKGWSSYQVNQVVQKWAGEKPYRATLGERLVLGWRDRDLDRQIQMRIENILEEHQLMETLNTLGLDREPSRGERVEGFRQRYSNLVWLTSFMALSLGLTQALGLNDWGLPFWVQLSFTPVFFWVYNPSAIRHAEVEESILDKAQSSNWSSAVDQFRQTHGLRVRLDQAAKLGQKLMQAFVLSAVAYFFYQNQEDVNEFVQWNFRNLTPQEQMYYQAWVEKIRDETGKSPNITLDLGARIGFWRILSKIPDTDTFRALESLEDD